MKIKSILFEELSGDSKIDERIGSDSGFHIIYGISTKPYFEYDYIVFTSNSKIHWEYSNIDGKISSMKDAEKLGKPIIVLCSPDFGYLLPLINSLSEKLGFKFKEYSRASKFDLKKSEFSDFFNNIKEYRLAFESIPKGSEIIATNPAGEAIAWTYKNYLFLPWIESNINNLRLDQKNLLLSLIVDVIKKWYPTSNIPSWFENYNILDEKETLKKLNSLESELAKTNEIKKIVAVKGKELENSFEYILNDLGIEFTRVGTSDFLITNKPKIIIEITGTEHNLRKEKVTQSIGHYEELKDEYGLDSKVCLIINHEIEKNPIERGPLDTYSIGLAAKNEICVISTKVLLNFYESIKMGNTKINDFIEKIVKTNGELKK